MRRYVEERGLPFFILIDEDRAVMKQYGVWQRINYDAWNIARPAVFVIEYAMARLLESWLYAPRRSK